MLLSCMCQDTRPSRSDFRTSQLTHTLLSIDLSELQPGWWLDYLGEAQSSVPCASQNSPDSQMSWEVGSSLSLSLPHLSFPCYHFYISFAAKCQYRLFCSVAVNFSCPLPCQYYSVSSPKEFVSTAIQAIKKNGGLGTGLALMPQPLASASKCTLLPGHSLPR